MAKPIANVVGFDDAPFAYEHRGDIRLVGAVCARTRLDGVLSGTIRRDGVNATATMTELVRGGRFRGHIRAVLLQGIAVGGFNVVDIHGLHEALNVPVKFLGVGEKATDLLAFDPAEFAREVLEG